MADETSKNPELTAEEQIDAERKKNEEEKNKKNKLKLSGTSFVVLAIVLSVFGLAGIGYFYAWPNYQTFIENSNKIQELSIDRDTKTLELAQLKKQNEEKKQSREEKEILAKIPPEVDTYQLIRDWDDFIKLSKKTPLDDLDTATISIPKPTFNEELGLYVQNFSFAFSSSEYSLWRIFEIVENNESDRIFNIKDFAYKPVERTETELTIFSEDPNHPDNKNYLTLLKKRSYGDLSDTEKKELWDYQQKIFEKYAELFKSEAAKDEENSGEMENSEEIENSELDRYKTEVDNILSEQSYTLNLEAYVLNPPDEETIKAK